jgi:hypothetical protein
MRSDPAFAAAVVELQPVLAAWHKGRKSQEHIPANVWHGIVRMARADQPSPPAQALRMNCASPQTPTTDQPIGSTRRDWRFSSRL